MSTFTKHDGSQVDEIGGGPVSHLSHGGAASVPARHGGPPNLARDAGRAKAIRPTPYHGSSTAKQIAGAHAGGLSHATQSGALATNILDAKLLPAKQHTKPVAAKWGMKDADGRGHDAELGRRVLDQALRGGGKDCAE